MKFILPATWWKLGFVWLSGIQSRRPPGRGRALFQNSLRVAVIGLSLSVAALSFTLGIVSGFQKHLAQAVSNMSGHGALYLSKWRNLEDLKKIKSLAPEGLQQAEAFWNSQGLIVGPKGGRGILIEGRNNLSNEKSNGKNEVWVSLGKPLAEYLGAKKNSQIKILLPGILQVAIPVRVRSLLDHGTYELDSRLVWIDDKSLRAYMDEHHPGTLGKRPGDAHGIRFYLDPKYSKSSYQKELSEWISIFSTRIAQDPNLQEPEPQLLSWRDQKNNLFGGIDLDKAMLSVVLSLLVVVSILNVAATLVVLFLERDKEIAVIMSLGMSRGQLVQWIGVQGFFLGLISALLGMGISFLASQWVLHLPFLKIPGEIYNLSSIPFSFEWSEQGLVFLFALLTAFLASLAVALRLSSVKVVQLLGFRR